MKLQYNSLIPFYRWWTWGLATLFIWWTFPEHLLHPRSCAGDWKDRENNTPFRPEGAPRASRGDRQQGQQLQHSVIGTATGEIQALGGSHAERCWPRCRRTSQKGSAQEGSTHPKSSLSISQVWRSPEKVPVYQEMNNSPQCLMPHRLCSNSLS